MKTEQINLRLEHDLVAALERVASVEAVDRATAIRRLLLAALREWEIDDAVGQYQRGEASIGRASEIAGVSQWELLDLLRERRIAYPLDVATVTERLEGMRSEQPIGVRAEETLPDIPPKPGGVLLVGINPAPISVAAGHYYQGRLGRRLWKRLERIGLLQGARPGAEDEAFADSGHGLTDLVKRPTRSGGELSKAELRAGVAALAVKLNEWKPSLVLFAFKEAAKVASGRNVHPGPGEPLEGVPTFLLSGPYAPRDEAERVDTELRKLVASRSAAHDDGSPTTQRVTRNDLERGQLRLPREAKPLLPGTRGEIEIVLRGTRLRASYDPRLGPDRERSAVLRVDKRELGSRVLEDERLRVSRGLGGVVRLD